MKKNDFYYNKTMQNQKIYFDNAATTAVSDTVIAAMSAFYKENYGNPSSIHALGRNARAAIEQARKTVARHINASIGEIFFTSGGSEGNNMAIKNAVRDLKVRRIITAATEHHCVLYSAQALARDAQVEVIYLKTDEKGHIDLKELEAFLQIKTTTLVSLMHANNEIGTLHNLQQISDLCEKNNAYLHTDTVQTMGKLPIDLQATKVHFLTASAHKFHGVKGVGFLYINNDVTILPFIDGGAQERNMRGGTENVAGIVALSVALDEAYANIDSRRAHISALKTYFIQQLNENFTDIEYNGDPLGESIYHILSISFAPSLKADMLIFNLDVAGVCASGGSACSSGVENASHVMAATRPDSDRRTVRFSLSYHNTFEEIDAVILRLKRFV
jgi:cysteine desulfurase